MDMILNINVYVGGWRMEGILGIIIYGKDIGMKNV